MTSFILLLLFNKELGLTAFLAQNSFAILRTGKKLYLLDITNSIKNKLRRKLGIPLIVTRV